MDILHLVDRLEELFNQARPIPLTHNVIVDEDRFLEIIDQMRISIPEEVKKSQQVIAQRDRLMAQAQEEANRTVGLAQSKAEGSGTPHPPPRAPPAPPAQAPGEGASRRREPAARSRRLHPGGARRPGGRAHPAAGPGA